MWPSSKTANGATGEHNPPPPTTSLNEGERTIAHVPKQVRFQVCPPEFIMPLTVQVPFQFQEPVQGTTVVTIVSATPQTQSVEVVNKIPIPKASNQIVQSGRRRPLTEARERFIRDFFTGAMINPGRYQGEKRYLWRHELIQKLKQHFKADIREADVTHWLTKKPLQELVLKLEEKLDKTPFRTAASMTDDAKTAKSLPSRHPAPATVQSASMKLQKAPRILQRAPNWQNDPETVQSVPVNLQAVPTTVQSVIDNVRGLERTETQALNLWNATPTNKRQVKYSPGVGGVGDASGYATAEHRNDQTVEMEVDHTNDLRSESAPNFSTGSPLIHLMNEAMDKDTFSDIDWKFLNGLVDKRKSTDQVTQRMDSTLPLSSEQAQHQVILKGPVSKKEPMPGTSASAIKLNVDKNMDSSVNSSTALQEPDSDPTTSNPVTGLEYYNRFQFHIRALGTEYVQLMHEKGAVNPGLVPMAYVINQLDWFLYYHLRTMDSSINQSGILPSSNAQHFSAVAGGNTGENQIDPTKKPDTPSNLVTVEDYYRSFQTHYQGMYRDLKEMIEGRGFDDSALQHLLQSLNMLNWIMQYHLGISFTGEDA